MRPRLVRASRHDRLGAAVLATVLAAVVGVSPAGVRPALAAGTLRIEADATYDLDPAAGRVHVAIDIELTNLKPNTATTFFYYTNALFVIHPDAVGIRAADASGPLSITTRERRFYTRVNVNLRSFLYYQESTRFTLSYDMVGGKPRSDSWVRVSRAFATFGVWAWGDAGRSTVEVRIPDGYEIQVDGDRMDLSIEGQRQALSAEPDRPRTFYAIVSADNLDAYSTDRVSLEGGIELVVRGWPNDDRWSDTVSDTLRVGMPDLVELIGLDWPVTHDLEVRERFTPALEGYAGLFLTDEERIEISEDLDPVTIMHEASHAWFSGDLFVERWIFEGLAQEYAWRVQTSVGGEAGAEATRPGPQDPGRIPLDSWRFPSVIRDQETDDREAYGYGASFWVVHNVVEAVGVDRMREAFASAADNLTAYAGAPAPERVPELDDWRRFLDLAQPIDQPESRAVHQAMVNLVLEPRDSSLMSVRQLARDRYRTLLAAGEGWLPPWYVRGEMSSWAFADASTAMDQATAVLGLRDDVEEAAAALALEPDDALRTAYESATTSFDDANAVAADQLEALSAIADARSKAEAPVDLVAQIGLLGATPPSASYDAARAAFERGELDVAVASAGAVATVLAGAATVGQERLVLGVVVALGVLLLVALFLVLRRRRRRRARLALAISPAAPSVPDAPEAPPPPPDWPAVDLATRATTEHPEPAWWLPTRNSPDPGPPGPSATLATDPASPTPPTAANPPDLEGDASPGELPPSNR